LKFVPHGNVAPPVTPCSAECLPLALNLRNLPSMWTPPQPCLQRNPNSREITSQ
jgi:hypothetical protein